MSKFKVGDRVLVVNRNYSVTRERKHFLQSGIITENHENPYIKFDNNWLNKGGKEDDSAYAVHENHLELEIIWNSPLYQALREE